MMPPAASAEVTINVWSDLRLSSLHLQEPVFERLTREHDERVNVCTTLWCPESSGGALDDVLEKVERALPLVILNGEKDVV